jgi:hypothetical protein
MGTFCKNSCLFVWLVAPDHQLTFFIYTTILQPNKTQKAFAKKYLAKYTTI